MTEEFDEWVERESKLYREEVARKEKAVNDKILDLAASLAHSINELRGKNKILQKEIRLLHKRCNELWAHIKSTDLPKKPE